jgi:hypothetical protein
MPSFSWGDTVQVRAEAGAAMRPGAIAGVVGIRVADDEAMARKFEVAIGCKLYLIEFGDGTAVEVPEAWIVAASG